MNLPLAESAAIVFAISFLTVLGLTPRLVSKLREEGFVSKDYNKKGRPHVPKFGGIAIALGFTLAALTSLQLSSQLVNEAHLLAAITTIILISFLGFIDDVIRVRDAYRVVLPAFAALPLMVVKAGNSLLTLPLIGPVETNLGVFIIPLLGAVEVNLYVLLLIPIGVVACSNLVNLLAGFNGLEAGVGAVACASLLAAMLLAPGGAPAEAVFILVAMLAACLAFLFFNWFPAKIFPGNLATYAIGAVLVCAVVLANMERVGVIALAPQIAEFFLKARTLFSAENFGRVKGGRLYYDGKICSLTHLLMRYAHPTEKQLVLVLLAAQALFGALAVASIYF